jgi:nucleotide-binding universal stress UspA family protein
MFKRILAATDSVSSCDAAVLTAAEIAKQDSATLYILHVLESAYSGKYRHFVQHFETGEEIVSGSEYEQKVKECIGKNCAEVLQQVGGYKIRVTPGFPYEQIAKYGRQENVDLIVLGPHSDRARSKGLSRFVGRIGSTVEGILKHERCPVMIVNRPVLKEPLSFNRIMVCIDFSKSCKSALQFAMKMAKEHSSELFIFHMLPVPASPSYPQGELEQDAYALKKKLEAFCKEVPEEIPHDFEVWEGTLPYLEILKYARDRDVDLIAMGSHTKGKDEKWYVGSAVEQVSARAMCPVAVVTNPKALRKMEQ